MSSPQDSITQAHYIIVGGGTSGLVVANRLTENPDVHVLVLEAGVNRNDDPRVQVPAFWTTLLGSEADWQFRSVPQPGLGGRTISEPQGKLLGGSSAINCQSFIAPAQAEIDSWAKLGNDGWDWAALSPYYKKFYTLSPPPDSETLEHLGIDWINEDYRGKSGPIQVSFPGVIQNPLCKAWIDSFRGFGKLTTGDPFSGNSTGAYSNAATVDIVTKTRSYAGSAYGIPALQRPNFHLITDATAHKILFEETSSGVVATGVLASVNGEIKQFTATKEVILAAGVFNTPKLLELSGIGNESLLKKHNIPVVISNSGVGENMQDHLMTGVSFEVVDGVPTGDPLLRQEPQALELAQKLYTENKAGPFTIGGVQSHAFMPILEFSDEEGRQKQAELLTSILQKYPPKPQDVEHFEAVRSIIESPGECSAAWLIFLAQTNLHEGGKSFVGSDLQPENFASLGCCQSHPFSRGSTHISSSNVDDLPEIDPRFLSHPADLEIFARHIQTLETLRQTQELSPFFKPDGKRNHPDSFHIHTLEGAKKYVLDTAVTAYHTCGTAAMLPKEKGGVVNDKLMVHGTSNLRVVDASIFPLIPRGNIQSSVYAVAEKAADIIKGV
ncbi:uncharacterized protein EAE98_002789 [Botrytis deweyae]|uniref:Glucose-methanol-choline oxidoreductase N-terminal domain-containing protein n=1 Tax=Botrytis deweyae TaxID=2478750 RepID=A0ABQ7IUQ7_9HELO|nr:uncharacterized protein EAE98_002789 [Botrytis deweyae]KAF7934744.1 hypothetical protein EAE98_002789 [Botrytis deweyae]